MGYVLYICTFFMKHIVTGEQHISLCTTRSYIHFCMIRTHTNSNYTAVHIIVNILNADHFFLIYIYIFSSVPPYPKGVAYYSLLIRDVYGTL